MSDTIITTEPGTNTSQNRDSTDTFLDASEDYDALQPNKDVEPGEEIKKNEQNGCCECCYDDDGNFSALSVCDCLAWLCCTAIECIQCGCIGCLQCIIDNISACSK